MPPVYNSKTSSGRTTEQLHLITPQEFDVAMATTSTELIGRAEVKIEGFRNEVSGLRKRCAERRPQSEESAVDINDSDIEDIQDDIGDVDSDFEIELLMPKPVKEESQIDADLANSGRPPHINQSVAGCSNSSVDGNMRTSNRLDVAENSDRLWSGDVQSRDNQSVAGGLNSSADNVAENLNLSGSNQNVSNDSDATYWDAEADGLARNEVSSSSEPAEQAIEDGFSGNLHYVQDVSIFNELKKVIVRHFHW